MNNAQSAPPFPFSDEARVIAVEKLFNDARASLLAQSAWIKLTLWHNIPISQCSDQGIVQLTNLLLVLCVGISPHKDDQGLWSHTPTKDRGVVERPQGVPAS